MELEGNSNARTSVASLRELRERHPCRLNVIWGKALRPGGMLAFITQRPGAPGQGCPGVPARDQPGTAASESAGLQPGL